MLMMKIRALFVGHARKAVSVMFSPSDSAGNSEYIPEDLVSDASSGDDSSSETDSNDDVRYDPTLLEDREMGFHVATF